MTTTTPRIICPPFDISPIPYYSSPRVLFETPPCVDPFIYMSAYDIYKNAYESICTHMGMECVRMTQRVESGSTHGGVSNSTRGEE